MKKISLTFGLLISVFLFGVFSFSFSSFGATIKIVNGDIQFKATGKPAMMRVLGEGNGLSGNLQTGTMGLDGVVEMDMATLTTKMTLRDKHMKEKYLEVEKFPKSFLKFKKIAVDPSLLVNGQSKETDFEADFTLHGVTKPIQGKIIFKSPSQATSAFKIDLTDYQVDTPSFAGVTIANEVEIEVNVNLEVTN